MLRVLSILFGAGFTVAVCWAAGTLLLRALGLKLHRGEERVLAFVVGAACLSLAMFAISIVHLARPGVFLALGAAILGAAFWRGAHRGAGEPLPPLGRFWTLLLGAALLVFGCLYFFNALAPEMSPDGAAYHLGLVSRYLRAHGLYRITTNMYANLSEGTELLYLFAFAFGRHSAASMVHFAFLLALPLAMLFYARRFGFAAAGATGALLVFLSPIVGWDGTTAYIDVAVTCVLFALFYLLQIWDRERSPGLLVTIGLLAGFAYAMKYTAGVAVPYALGFVGWKMLRKRSAARELRRGLAVVGVCALVMIAPWAIKNWVWVGNPFSPFLNKLFPNPYVHVQFEREYRQQLANWGDLKTKWDIPLETTVRGARLQGVLGPAFLLFPVALLALRWRAGRQLLLAAAVFLVPYPANLGTRFLIPMLPFLSLGLGLVLVNWKAAAPALVIFHGLTSWPAVVQKYCAPYAVQIERMPVRAALRRIPEDVYLESRSPGYQVSRLLDEKVPAEAKVFAFTSAPEAYTARDMLVGYEAAFNSNLSDVLWAPLASNWQPTRRLRFRFAEQRLRRIRVVQTAADQNEMWSVSELRVYRGRAERQREPQWRLRARPNPWEIQRAFDNNPMTRWRTWEPIRAGMYVEVDFGRAEAIDQVVLESTPDQYAVRLKLEGDSGGGAWQQISGWPEQFEAPAPAQMRRLAAEEVKWEGVEYLLIQNSDLVAEDMRKNRILWGLEPVFGKNDFELYRIE